MRQVLWLATQSYTHQLRGDRHCRSPRMVLYRHLDLPGESEFEKPIQEGIAALAAVDPEPQASTDLSREQKAREYG